MVINEILDAVVTTLEQLTDSDGSPYFKFVNRGRVLPQSLPTARRPSASVILLQEGQISEDFDAMLSGVMFGVLMHSDEFALKGEADKDSLKRRDTEVLEMAVNVKLGLEQMKPTDVTSPIRFMKIQSPEVNAAIPLGSVMTVFSCFYGEERP